jgi:hypothetical protein
MLAERGEQILISSILQSATTSGRITLESLAESRGMRTACLIRIRLPPCAQQASLPQGYSPLHDVP